MTYSPRFHDAPSDDSALVRERAGRRCICNNTKGPGKTFCAQCYFQLSPDLRRALYLDVGAGYAEAYAKALERLRSLAQKRADRPQPGDEPPKPAGRA